jgi:hypothetical protein
MNRDHHRPASEEILARARRAWSPSAADAERVRRAATAALAGGGALAATAAPTSPTPSPSSSPSSSWAAKLWVAALTASVSGGAGYWVGHRAGVRDARPPAAAISPAQPTEPIASPALTAAPVAVAAESFALPPASGHRAPQGPRHGTGAAAASEPESLAIEVQALRNAERALRDGAPGLALTFLQELDRRVPRGRLTEERDAAATLARCMRGDRPFDVDLAADFVGRYPRSVYRPRVEQACAATDSPASGDSPAWRPDK